jgi:DNA primase
VPGSRIGSASVERVREAADITAVISRFVPLQRSGRSMRGLCPFHREKTPSFYVSPDRQSYHCFGCGAGGDVFSFLMNFLGLTFPEAVEELAQECGVDISHDSAPDAGESVRKVLAEAQAFFRTSLGSPEGRAARAYVAGRALSQKTIEEIGIGWAPPGGILTRHLTGLGYSSSTLEEAGLVVRGDDSRNSYDRFRNRITFPIADRRGRVASFGARAMGEDIPKYLNGPDSPVYRKGELLYGFQWARNAARDADSVVLVEGYFDHARLFESGFAFCVATCGTALTPSQARQLAAMAGSVLVCYDADPAGVKASLRAVEILLAERCYPSVMVLDPGTDPDDFVRKSGAAAFLTKMEGALDPVQFALHSAGGWGAVSARGRSVAAVGRLVRLASLSPDPLARDAMLKRIGEMTGFSASSLAESVATHAFPAQKTDSGARPTAGDLTILRALVGGRNGLDRSLLGAVEDGDLSSAGAVSLLAEIREQAAEGFSSPVPGRMKDEPARLCAEILAEAQPLGDGEAERLVELLRRKRLVRARAELMSRLQGAGEEERTEILRQLNARPPKVDSEEEPGGG